MQDAQSNMTTATPKFPLGTFVFNPDSTDPAAEATFEAQFNAFTDAMGAAPQFMDAFTNWYADWSQWVPTEDALAASWAADPQLRNVTPVMTIPMASANEFSNPDQAFKDIVAGKHDDVITGLINSWKSAGYTTVDARIGYEMNGKFVPWYMGDDPGTVADWVAAFQHIADLVHADPGMTVKTVWNPVVSNYTNQPTSSSYPGDKYVDVIGADIYSTVYPVELYDWDKNDGTIDQTQQQWFADPVNREHYWLNPNATQYNPNGYDPAQWGFKQALAFATAHNKPIGLAETGAGGDGTSTGPVDDPDFPKWLAGQLSQPGAPQVAFVNIWDIDPSDGNWEFTDGSKPQELAAWQQYFGVPQAANFQISDMRTGVSSTAAGTAYTGPVAGLQNQFIMITSDNINITATVPNSFIHTGSGVDAIDVSKVGGTNVLDGSTGSNFLSGGTGTDTFFVDDRIASADIWSTVVNFHAGDAVTIFGVTSTGFNLDWKDDQGAVGHTGLTLHATAPGKPVASVTLAGYAKADLGNGRLTVSFGTDTAANSYLYIHGN